MGRMSKGSKNVGAALVYAQSDQVDLTATEVRNLVGICIELVNLCARVTGKFDPAMGTMIRYARDQALCEALNIHV
jgi:hypothetical protein